MNLKKSITNSLLLLLAILLLNPISAFITTADCGCDNNQALSLHGHNTMSSPIYIDPTIPIPQTNQIPLLNTPDYYNWKDIDGKDYMSPTKNQGNCGSCWDFAALAMLEALVNIKEDCHNLDCDLSEQYVLSCLPAAANNYGQGCFGGQHYNCLNCIMNETETGNNFNGVPLESCFPYQADHTISCSQKCPDWQDQAVPVADVQTQTLGFDSEQNRETIKSALMQYGPIGTFVNVTTKFINWGEYHHDSNEYYSYDEMEWANYLNHAVVIVGWKDDTSIPNGGYWICKNSWGDSWGYEGFYNIEYGCYFTGFIITWADYDPEAFDWPPVADPGGIYTGSVEQSISFDATQSFDAEGEIISYLWDFGDGTTSTEPQPTHSYSATGTYTVSLTVTDNTNQSSTITTTAAIETSPLSITSTSGRGITITLENEANHHLNNQHWTATFQALMFPPKTYSGTHQIPAQSTISHQIKPVGIGPGRLTYQVGGIEEQFFLFMLGPIIISI